ncbi:hypothetical protein [Actinomycetospora cinnamomea]|uniref:CYTH domain-containing protein n=1 Tax=Actinomycetospora cinnamomea TaxID=663609 RepID=A0A2U1E7V5_9PSEU|nr:hypothetical protein [Actinomycetospora cinnamomea]PVY96027.1 hypothetical protein C8D89_13323 [Actinomycetospora cinnamomea]
MLDHVRASPASGLAPAPRFPPDDDPLWASVASAGADSVELKVLLLPGAGAVPSRFTGGHPGRVRQRRLYLLDTADLLLARVGVHVRLRDRGRDRWDLTVRVRGEDAVAALPRPAGARVEVDVLPGRALHSTELREALAADRAVACRDGALDVHALMTAAQGALLAAAVPHLAGALHVHGPLTVERAVVPRPRCGLAHARHERCRFPGGRVLEEFSARCPPGEAPTVARALAHFLSAHGAAPATRQRTKTAAWLEELLAGAP